MGTLISREEDLGLPIEVVDLQWQSMGSSVSRMGVMQSNRIQK